MCLNFSVISKNKLDNPASCSPNNPEMNEFLLKSDQGRKKNASLSGSACYLCILCAYWLESKQWKMMWLKKMNSRQNSKGYPWGNGLGKLWSMHRWSFYRVGQVQVLICSYLLGQINTCSMCLSAAYVEAVTRYLRPSLSPEVGACLGQHWF